MSALYIAWLHNTSIASGTNQEDVMAHARAVVQGAPMLKRYGVLKHHVTITEGLRQTRVGSMVVDVDAPECGRCL